MTTVNEYIKRKVAKGDVGIEIEVEGNHLKAVDNAVWRSADDGSLRGVYPVTKCEYILASPIPVGAVYEAVKGLREELKDAEMKFSYRTSVHVHVNVQRLKLEQMLSFMYAYYLLEEPLMNFCGKGRKGNNFCLRLADAEGVMDWVSGLFEFGFEGIEMIPNDNARYAAMNIEAIKKYGSVEFRGMEGNMDVERIDTWCKALVALRTYGESKTNPQDVYNDFVKEGPMGFMKLVLGDLASSFVYARVTKDMEVSFSISIDLPFAYRVVEVQKESWEYEIGEKVNYEQAVKINANGGLVKGAPQRGRYIVVDKAKKPKAFKIPKAMPQGWAIDDLQGAE